MKQCEVCGKYFQGKKSNQRYCCKECKKEHRKQYIKQYNKENRQKLNDIAKEYFHDEQNNRKHRVRLKTARLVRSGRLIKGKCAGCGSNENIQAHHISYKQEYCQYSVVWLCRSCHLDLHLRLRNKEK